MAGQTAATRELLAKGVDFDTHPYRYVGGGAPGAAEALGVPVAAVAKTIVLEADGRAVIVVAPGDREVSTRAVGRLLGAKRVVPASEQVAEKTTGYRVGGISPFGTRRGMPVLCDQRLTERTEVLVNGGRRGLLVSLDPAVFEAVLGATVADVTH